MPVPGTRNAPKFKGKKVSEFLDTLEALGDAAGIDADDLPFYVYRYCSSKVQNVIRNDRQFKAHNWDAARRHLVDLYGSEDTIPEKTPEQLRTWTKRFRKHGSISSLREADHYYREFHSIATPLLEDIEPLILKKEVQFLFYRGLPDDIRKRVKKRLPDGETTVISPPSIKNTRKILQALFNKHDIDAESRPRKHKHKNRKYDTSSSDESSDSDSSDSSSESDSEDELEKSSYKKKTANPTRAKEKEKRSDRIESPIANNPPLETRVPAVPTHDTADIPSITQLSQQLEQLRIALARATTSPAPQQAPPPPVRSTYPTQYPADPGSRVCFICKFENGVHRLGTHNCPEAAALVHEKLAKYSTTTGKLVRYDGTDLPRTPGNIATTLRNEQVNLKGLARAGHDLPPHMANTAGLLCNGSPFLPSDDDDNYFYSSQTNISQPVTRSQTNNNRHNPIQRPVTLQEQQEKLKIRLPPRPPAATRTPPTPPVTQPTIITPATDTSPPEPPVAADSVAPPAPNTREGWKRRKENKLEDVAMADLKDHSPPTRTGPAYRLTNEVQKMVDLDTVFKRMLDSTLTVTVAEVLAMSPEMQKRANLLTKLQKEYTAKSVRFAPIPGDESDSEIGYDAPIKTTLMSNSNIRMAFDPEADDVNKVENTMERFAHMVKAHTNEKPLLAMSTGRFQGTVNGIPATFMIDSGSELNLIPLGFFKSTGYPLDLEGQRWSLVGINGVTTPLAGCARNVPIEFGGHRFDHHFFVNGAENGNGEVILGQPWLQWHSVAVLYSREGTVQLEVYRRGNRDKTFRDQLSIPTVTVQICSPNSPRNTDTLHRCSHRATIEEVTDDEGN